MTKANKNTRKILIAVVVTIVVAIAGFVIYNKVGYSLDKQKFIQLRKDMLSLQKEFNEIDSGWEYKEWCNSRGGVYEQHVTDRCWSGLYNDSINDFDKYDKVSLLKNMGYESMAFDTTSEFLFKENQSISCRLATSTTEPISQMGLTCSGQARDFYFTKNIQ